MDPLDIVMDEVALEGLDGVTILSLWIRLEKRNPAFPRNLDPCTKEFIWKSLVSNHEVDFYELPQERADVVLVDRFADIDPDTGIQEASHWDRVDSYPVQILLEDKSGIQGSCVFFNERRNVTPIIRTTNLMPCVTVEDAFKRWGRKLVMVASQRLRFRVLIGDGGDPDLKLTDHSYCILERVGRARWQGELQRDLHSCSFKTDPRKMHYLRKSLTQNDLITMQSHVLRLASGAQQHSILLLLKRFHVDRRSKYDILMELTSNLLSEAPNHTASMITLRDQLVRPLERTFKRMYQYMQAAKLVQVVIKPVEHLNPTVGPCDTRRGTKVVARCLKLIKPYVRKEVVEAEDDDDNDDDDGGGANRKTVPTEGRIMERDFLSQAYGIIVSCGTKGISQSALRARMCIGKLESRMICRLLERTDMIKGFMEDEGRQRTTKYLGHLHVDESDLLRHLVKEQERSERLRTVGGGGEGEGQFSGLSRDDRSGSSPGSGWAAQGHSENLSECMNSLSESLFPPPSSLLGQEHHRQTYRLLKRKNVIVEAVQSLKIIEGLFTIQRLVQDEEKLDGVNTKCCKKSILRLIRSLSKEGMLKLFRTTVIQDGVSKKVEFIVHPSVSPSDALVKSAIEQVRFRISSSYPATPCCTVRQTDRQTDRQTPCCTVRQTDTLLHGETDTLLHGETDRQTPFSLSLCLPPVPGLSRSLGYQPKMPRLRLTHTFLWYLVYGHPLRHPSTPTPPDLHNTSSSVVLPTDNPGVQTTYPTTPSNPSQPQTTHPDDTHPSSSEHTDLPTVSWRRFIPPAPVHREFGPGWALTSDVVLCLPLSIYIQIIQISFKVDGLEEYLNDPVKQHYLIRFLPSRMKTQLLHKRKYIFSFHDSMQRLIFMGLLQFGPVEKFQDKDQVYLYVKRNCMIVDTTMCEPHYNLVLETRVFERRRYTLNTLTDVDNYWFDLMCVCLNTPLGRPPPHTHTHTHMQKLSLSTICLGSREVCYTAVIPGDGKGAGGLDSEFFGHLKRNWIWTCHLMRTKRFPGPQSSKQRVPAGLRLEEVHISTEPSSRNRLVKGGKKQKRKRTIKLKKQAKTPQKKKKGGSRHTVEVRKRPPVHDAADHKALMMMTRQRVTWSVSEDSVLILCRVASHFLNRKLRRPFVPWCVVRDLLHAEFEESLDKTSPSVGRRSRYILKNPQTHLNYKICLAEVYQDKPLIAKLQGRKHDPNDPKVTHTHHPSVHDHKVTHTHTHTTRLIEDIHSLVLNNLIQSTLAMSNSQMKCCRSFQTFHTYSRYRQEVLCQVFVQCRKKGLVNRRRISQLCGPNKNRALPILPMSYQLSQSYYRCFTWRLPTGLCTEVFDFMQALSENGTGDNHPSTFINVPLTKSRVLQMLQFSLESPGGATLACLSLMTLGLLSVHVSIPEHIVVLDSTMVDNEVVKSISVLAEDDDEEEENEGRRGIEVRAHKASHTKYLMMRGYCVPGIVNLRNLNTNDSIVVESCTMRLYLRHTPVHTLFITQGRYTHLYTHCLLPRVGTHTCDLLEEELLLEVGGSSVRLVLLSHAEPWLLTSTERQRDRPHQAQRGASASGDRKHHNPLLRKRRMVAPREQEPRSKRGRRETLMEEEEEERKKIGLREEEDGEASGLREEEDGEASGLREEEDGEASGLREEEDGEASGLREEEDGEASDLREEEDDSGGVCDVSFVSRPWRIVDGSLNRPVCKGMLDAVLYHVMTRPGLPEHVLLEHYRGVLQPVVVLDLVQALVELGCIKKRYVTRRPKPSLFSRPAAVLMVGEEREGETGVRLEETGVRLEETGVRPAETTTVFYEPTIDCCLRLGQVLPHENNWNQWVQFAQHENKQ
uniref:B-block binding subunit of TFIIIC domain-containing protein n=1 Tax=Oncorhynchus mykiss TaxID=8022 RepID=A0A8K9XY13_ONCMY